jgi:hypothetical protein
MPYPPRVTSVALYVLTNPWRVFVERWNWKAALLSALYRGGAFAIMLLRLSGADSLRGIYIEIAFRIAVGGCWGALLQAFRAAQPRWLATFSVTVALPLATHCLEFAVLRLGNASHIKTSMAVSVLLTIGSLCVNLALMRRGILLTGGEGGPLLSDFRRIPGALADMLRGLCRRRLT